MRTRKEAVDFLRHCAEATVKAVHANESGKRLIIAAKNEKDAYAQAFQAYTGSWPNEEELKQILE